MEIRKATLLDLAEETRAAVRSEMFLLALSQSLTFPDIGARVLHASSGKKGEYYIDWFDRYASKFFLYPPDDSIDYPTFDGKACYSLRNSVLHSAKVDIDNDRSVSIDEFELCIAPGSQRGGGDSGGVRTYSLSGRVSKRIKISVNKLCYVLCDAVEEFYEEQGETKVNEFSFSYLDFRE